MKKPVNADFSEQRERKHLRVLLKYENHCAAVHGVFPNIYLVAGRTESLHTNYTDR